MSSKNQEPHAGCILWILGFGPLLASQSRWYLN